MYAEYRGIFKTRHQVHSRDTNGSWNSIKILRMIRHFRGRDARIGVPASAAALISSRYSSPSLQTRYSNQSSSMFQRDHHLFDLSMGEREGERKISFLCPNVGSKWMQSNEQGTGNFVAKIWRYCVDRFLAAIVANARRRRRQMVQKSPWNLT